MPCVAAWRVVDHLEKCWFLRNLNLKRASWHLSGFPNGLRKCHPPPARQQAKPNKEALDEGGKLQGTESSKGKDGVGGWTLFQAFSCPPLAERQVFCGAKKHETGVSSTRSPEPVRMARWNKF